MSEKKKPEAGLKTVYMNPPAGIARWNARLTMLATVMLGILVSVWYVNRTDEVGLAGVVGRVAKGMDLNCGDTIYVPMQNGVFHPGLPCGSIVRVSANGKVIDLPVVSTKVTFSPGYDRVADLSLAAAQELGLDKADLHKVSLRVLRHGSDGSALGVWSRIARTMTPMVDAFQHATRAPKPLPFTKEERWHMVKNVLSEAEVYGEIAYLPVVITTVNRFLVSYRGKGSLKGVIYDPWQFTWTQKGYEVNNSKPGTKAWREAEGMVDAVLADRLSGNALAFQYMVRRCIVYYDPNLITPPKWGKFRTGKFREEINAMLQNGEFRLIEMWNSLEIRSGARCLEPVPGKAYAKRLETALR